MNDFIPRRGLPVGEVLASLSINHIIDRETMTMFSKWYQDTALEEFTKIAASKLNSTNLGEVMSSVKKLVPDVTTIQQLILDIKRIQFQIEAIILGRGMTSRTNVKALAAAQIKMIGGSLTA
ncbi:MAG: hypothetical protein KKD69_06105 [Euryarchaeota archaeon]|nr:hypothetical protein [Euryarchaeota archaeon]MBU4492019.1 hypothetical protein [Euryarchaeota archaeon]MCG2727407.1 hypothetical protein [Candidatus Methanoperedenaceae archaeon]